jgi:hypothetical protein
MKADMWLRLMETIERALDLLQAHLDEGGFQDQGDAKWILIRGSLWSHYVTLCGRPTPDLPTGHPGVCRFLGEFGVLVTIN